MTLMQPTNTTRKVLLSLQALALACTVSITPQAALAEDTAPPTADTKATQAPVETAPAASPDSAATTSTTAPAATPATAPASTPAATTTQTKAAETKASETETAGTKADETKTEAAADPSEDRRAKRKAQQEAEKETIRKKKEAEKGSYYGTIAKPTVNAPNANVGTGTYYETIKNAPRAAPPPPSAPIPLAPVVIDGAHQKVAPSANPMGAAGKGWKDDASVSGSITLTRHVNTAKEMLDKGNWTLAKKHFGSAMAIEPSNMEYMVGYYKSCLLGQDWPSVINTLEKVFRKDPTKEKLYYADYGKALYFNNQVPEATMALKKAMTLGNNLESVHETMLGMYQYQRDCSGVATEYKALIKLNPARTERIKALADLLWQTGNQGEAATYYKQYAKTRPTDAEAHQQLGYILATIQDYPGSIAAYKKALAISPHDPRAKQGLQYAQAQQKAAASGDDE
jgi:tetratricopeptide (TPR) repeat protein